MKTNAATDSNDHSEMPTQPIALAYFNRRPVRIDHYLCRERSGFLPVLVAVGLTAAALVLAPD